MWTVNTSKIQKEEGTTVWTLRGADSQGVMQIRQSPDCRDTAVAPLVSVEIPLTTWSSADLQRAAALMAEVAAGLKKNRMDT